MREHDIRVYSRITYNAYVLTYLERITVAYLRGYELLVTVDLDHCHVGRGIRAYDLCFILVCDTGVAVVVDFNNKLIRIIDDMRVRKDIAVLGEYDTAAVAGIIKLIFLVAAFAAVPAVTVAEVIVIIAVTAGLAVLLIYLYEHYRVVHRFVKLGGRIFAVFARSLHIGGIYLIRLAAFRLGYRRERGRYILVGRVVAGVLFIFLKVICRVESALADRLLRCCGSRRCAYRVRRYHSAAEACTAAYHRYCRYKSDSLAELALSALFSRSLLGSIYRLLFVIAVIVIVILFHKTTSFLSASAVYVSQDRSSLISLLRLLFYTPFVKTM